MTWLRRAPTRWCVRLVLALLAATTIVVSAAAPSSAHASLVATDPEDGAVVAAAPDVVTFTFDEAVSLVADGVEAYDAAGQPVEVEAAGSDAVITADLPDALAEGTYVVTWRVVSSDGHPIAGSLTFHVGAPSETVVAPQAAGADDGPLRTAVALVQGIGYVSLLLAGGLVIFLGWTTRGIGLHDAVRRRLVLALRAGAGVALVAAALAVPLAGAYQQGLGLGGVGDPDAFDPVLTHDQITVLLLHVIGLGVVVYDTGRARQSIASDLAAALAVWSPALAGHTQGYEPVSLLVVTDALHLSAGAVWLGGLVGLLVTLGSLRGRARETSLLVSRFSTMAAGILALLVASGVLLSWRILGSWSGLVDTTYGRLLLVKIGIVLVVVAIAGWNRYRLVPRVAEDTTHERRRRATTLVRRAVTVEAVLIVTLLGVTGFLVDKPPGGDPPPPPPGAAGTGVVTAAVDDLRVLALLDDADGRVRTLTVQVQDASGEPVDLVDQPEVSLRSGDIDLGIVPVEPVASGTYATEVAFPTLGVWEVQVSLRIGEFANPVTTLAVDVR